MTVPHCSPTPPDPPKPVEPSPDSAIRLRSEWRLSPAQARELFKAMRTAIWKEGCPKELHDDALHDAFVAALSKDISERVPVAEWDRFVAWMCTLAKYAAMTNRNGKLRRREYHERKADEIREVFSARDEIKDLLALARVQKAYEQLEEDQRALLEAHYVENKSIQEIANALDNPRTTIQSRLDRALHLLRVALQVTIVAVVVFVTKTARAQGARLAWHVSRLFPHASQAACALTAVVACGGMVPASSVAVRVRQDALASEPLAPSGMATTASRAPTEPLPSEEVAPVKPIGLDEPEAQWSDRSMNPTTITNFLQKTAIPATLAAACATSQGACIGAETQRPPPQQDVYDGIVYDDKVEDAYTMACAEYRRRGEACPSREEWEKK